MPGSLPAVTGNQLIKLLSKDAWQKGRKASHGRTLWKEVDGRKRITYIPEKNDSLPAGTLSAILGPKQTTIGRDGLAALIAKFGL